MARIFKSVMSNSNNMSNTNKTPYDAPVVRLIGMEPEGNLALSDLTLINPYEDEQDW